MKVENENIFQSALRNGVNLFIGAGFSRNAEDREGKTLPLGQELTRELVAHFAIPEFSDLPLSQLCTYLKSTNRQALLTFLVQRFTVERYSVEYDILTQVPIKWLFSTNIDDLPFKIFKNSADHYLNDIDSSGPTYGDAKAVQYVALHGSVRHPERDFIFGSEELAAAFAEDNDRWRFLTQALQQTPTLFIGYSVADAAVLQALNPKSTSGRPHKEKWLVVHPNSYSKASEAVFRALGFSIIVGDTSAALTYIRNLNTGAEAPRSIRNVSTKVLFPNESIPTLSDVPVRPVRDFFLGAPPEWSDIFSHVVHRTSHYTKAKDLILAGNHVAIIGSPACGKSTLLMQLASSIETSQRKLFTESLTEEKAQNIATQLSGEPCLLFIDNFSDSLSAIEVLAGTPSIQFVGADRDFAYSTVSHKMKDLHVTHYDITELSESDVQMAISSIPATLSARANPKRTTKRQSLFEIVEAHVNVPTLRSRFKKVLAQLASSDRAMHDMLVMMCYVFSCRTPVSMDMLIAFCRSYTSDWEEVAKIRSDLGQMITEYFGEYAAADQDYFCPRSSYVAEAVLEVISSSSLRRILEEFHTQVSPARVCRFDVFRRSAYDEKLVSKAFDKWEEGKAFYEKLITRDTSPFLYQQAALYLSRKGQHHEAFTMIDLAITASQGKSWSIRNSHAIVLFRANIGYAEQEKARSSLKRSMDTLKDCYKWDRRKAFHAFTYAQQALDLWVRIRDIETASFLAQAKTWLLEAIRDEPWNRQCRYMLPKIDKAIASSL